MSWLSKYLLKAYFVHTYICYCFCDISQKHPGHLKPFGSVGPFERVEEVHGYPNTKEFFKNYVSHMKPVKLKNACRSSPAYTLWSDSYFASLSSLKEEYVMVENGKIEDRNKPLSDMSFMDFLKTYNYSNNYLVSTVPNSLSSDVLLPQPLQCPDIYQNLLLVNIMWMSSGGTSSVVHIDSVDNIICLLRGDKQFVLLDPKKYSQQVLMEHPDEGYSDIDVNRVDYTKYFGLVNVTYHVVNLTAGDCLFIPYQWIHQVASYNSNIAVNIWWDHTRNHLIDLDTCILSNNPSITLRDVTFHGLRSSKVEDFKSELSRHLRKKMDFAQFFAVFLTDNENLNNLPSEALYHMQKMFFMFDANRDGTIAPNEVENMSLEDWALVESHFTKYEQSRTTNKSYLTPTFKEEL